MYDDLIGAQFETGFPSQNPNQLNKMSDQVIIKHK